MLAMTGSGPVAGPRSDPIASEKRREGKMKLNAPKQTTWLIALIIGVIGILGELITIPVISISGIAIWLVVVAFVLLLLATVLSNL